MCLHFKAHPRECLVCEKAQGGDGRGNARGGLLCRRDQPGPSPRNLTLTGGFGLRRPLPSPKPVAYVGTPPGEGSLVICPLRKVLPGEKEPSF